MSSDAQSPDSAPPIVHTGQTALPGAPGRRALIDRIVRVDHAGEFGARRIYEGQLAVLRNHRNTPVIQRMLEQELHHVDVFEKMVVDRRVRPTLLQPFWHVAGFALGAATALMGARAAMACTVAVETVIDEHYASQAAQLGEDEAPLKATIEAFRADEIEHRDLGLAHEAEQTPGYPLLSGAIKAGTRAAIWLSERI
jgi:ubiquinone biosynthesis monooxygenase Coq7